MYAQLKREAVSTVATNINGDRIPFIEVKIVNGRASNDKK